MVPDVLLVEREAEVALLDTALQRAIDGDGALLMVEGQAGAGKTRLVEHCVAAARARDMDVLSARGSEVDQSFPLGVVLQLFERRLAGADPTERRALLGGAAALAAPLLGGAPPILGPEAVFSYQHGLYWLLANLAGQRPVLVAIDDAQWADGPSLHFLMSVAHKLKGLAVALVIVRRLGEGGEADVWLDRLAGADAVVLRVPPLSDGAVTSLVRASYEPDADAEFCAACARAVGGNPLYLHELLSALRSHEIPASAEAARFIERIDPEGLKRSIGARLERAGPEAVALAEAAAIVEYGLPLRLVARLAGLEHQAAVTAAHLLAEADVLTGEDPVRFVHPVVRNAVYARLTGRRRASANRRAAELLHTDGAEVERVAAHLQLGDTRGEEWAIDTLARGAASAASRGAHGTAAAWLARALEEGPPQARRAALTAQLGLAELASGRLEAVERIRQAAAMTNSPPDRAQYLATAARISFYLGHFANAAELAQQAVEAVDTGDHPELLDELIADRIPLVAMLPVPFPSALERLRSEAARIAASGSTSLHSSERAILCGVASWGTLTGELPASRVSTFGRLALAATPADEFTNAMNQLAWELALADDFDGCESEISRAIEAARNRGLLPAFAGASLARAQSRYRRGSLSGATADAEAAMGAVHQGITGLEPVARAVLGLCLLDRGETDGARTVLQLENPERWSGFALIGLFHEARGIAALAAGASADALAAFSEAEAAVEPAEASNPSLCAWRSGAAIATSALGDSERAVRLCSDELSRAQAFGAPRAIGRALRRHGLILGPDEGLPMLDEAVAVLSASEARLEYAEALLDRGAMKRRNRQPREARDDLRRALDEATACSAPGVAARANEELMAAGGRPRRARLQGPEALTPAERRVAGMAAHGMSNPEIAQALFVTRKTIEAQMRSIFLKLDVRARGEIPAALVGDASAPDAHPAEG